MLKTNYFRRVERRLVYQIPPEKFFSLHRTKVSENSDFLLNSRKSADVIKIWTTSRYFWTFFKIFYHEKPLPSFKSMGWLFQESGGRTFPSRIEKL